MCVLGAPGVACAELFADTGNLFARRHSLNAWGRDFIVLDPWSLSLLTSVCDGAMGAKPNIEELMSLFIVASMVERGDGHRRAPAFGLQFEPPDSRSNCWKRLLASKALAGAAMPARTDKAMRADTIIFMAVSPSNKRSGQHHCRPSLRIEMHHRQHSRCAVRHVRFWVCFWAPLRRHRALVLRTEPFGLDHSASIAVAEVRPLH
jgi:hypothetical protein